MPDHHLHPYFRYLVDHAQLLKADNITKSEDNKNDNQHSGALSLLGSVYGSGEDEDGASDVTDIPNSSGNMDGNDRKVLLDSSKVKESASSKNRVFVKPAYANGVKKDTGVHISGCADVDKSKAPSMFPVPKGEGSLAEPPSEVKRLVDRMVEIILKNGKDFESVLIEQDKKHGKFSFLLPSNQYHSYYLEVLKKAQEARVTGKSFGSEKDFSSWQETDKKSTTKESNLAIGELPLEHDQDRKEKFKMVINKSKKESQDQPSKETHDTVISVDAAAAILQAATRGIKKPNLTLFSKTSLSNSTNEVVQASSGSFQTSQPPCSAQRGSDKNNGNSSVTVPVAKEYAKTAAVDAAGEADSSEAGLTREQKLKAERLRRAKMFAAMIKSGSAPLGKEQPPRASSVEPLVCGVLGVGSTAVNDEVKGVESVVPEKLVKDGSGDEHEMKSRKTQRHYRSRQHDDNEEDENEVDDEEDGHKRYRKKHKSHRSGSKDRHKRRRRHSSKSKRSRRHRKHDISSDDDGHRHHRRHKHDDSYDSSEDDGHRHHRRHKHDDDSEEDDGHRYHRRHKHDDDSEEDDGHMHHHRHKRDDDSEEDDGHRHHRRHKHDDDSEEDDENRHHRRHKHDGSSEDEHKHHKRRTKRDVSDDDDDDDDGKHRRRKHKRSKKDKDTKEREDDKCNEVELEEGEIRSKSSDQSPSTSVGDDNASREASVGVSKSLYEDKSAPSLPPPSGNTEVPDELRAKIRAMLLATM